MKTFLPENDLDVKKFTDHLEEFLVSTTKSITSDILKAKSKDGRSFSNLLNEHHGKVPMYEAFGFLFDLYRETDAGEYFRENDISSETITKIIKKINLAHPIVEVSSRACAVAKCLAGSALLAFNAFNSANQDNPEGWEMGTKGKAFFEFLQEFTEKP